MSCLSLFHELFIILMGCLSFFTCSSFVGGVGGECVVDWYEGHTYLFCDTDMDFWDAQDMCRDLGFELTALSDVAEEIWVSDRAASIRGGSWSVGFTDQDEEGTFAWTTGEPVEYTDWAAGEPNDYGTGEDCTEILWSGYAWNDYDCDDWRPFICEG